MKLYGFEVGNYQGKKVPLHILFPNENRRLLVMESMEQHTYSGHLKFRRDRLMEANKDLADKCWTTRTDDEVAMMNHYISLIEDINNELHAMKYTQNIELEKENEII